MAWRIHHQVVRGFIDNRIQGKVTGSIWLAGREQPFTLELQGNAWPDLAGCLLEFNNPSPIEGDLAGFADQQRGICGDMTASRKVKVPTVPLEKLAEFRGKPFPFVWGNSIYLEWFSERNGRVVIESCECQLSLSPPLWRLTEQEAAADIPLKQKAMEEFMQNLQRLAERRTEHPDDSNRVVERSAAGQLERIEQLKRRTREVVGDDMIVGGSDAAPLDIEEQFWKNMLAFETAPLMTRRELLEQDGIRPVDSLDLSEEEVHAELWHLVEGLARRRIYLESTDHLSNRELYQLLVECVLDQETEVIPPELGWNCHVSIQEYGRPGDEDGSETYLRFYADELTREQWANDFPEDQLPPHEEPPYDRDRFLPKPEY